MYRLVIIDDEKEKADSIESVIDWRKHDIEVCGVAYEGISGFRMICELLPDVALVDIRMPGMSGLELIEKAREHNINTQVVILSGYDEFSYAQQAIHLRVSEYLLKPCRSKEIVEAVVRSLRNRVPRHCVNTIVRSLKNGDLEGIRQETNALFSLAYVRQSSSRELRRLCSDFLHELLSLLVADGFSIQKLRVDFSQAFEMVDRVSSVQDAHQMLDMVLEDIVKSLRLANTLNPQIQYVIDYINEHHMENICLETLAREVHYSPPYLSLLFKKETGVNFVDYLNQVRVAKAKEMLGSPHLRVYEVAYAVGFTDEKYFSRVFRKYTGMTVSEYRKASSSRH